MLNLGHKTKLVAKAHSKVETHLPTVINIYIYITPGSVLKPLETKEPLVVGFWNCSEFFVSPTLQCKAWLLEN